MASAGHEFLADKLVSWTTSSECCGVGPRDTQSGRETEVSTYNVTPNRGQFPEGYIFVNPLIDRPLQCGQTPIPPCSPAVTRTPGDSELQGVCRPLAPSDLPASVRSGRLRRANESGSGAPVSRPRSPPGASTLHARYPFPGNGWWWRRLWRLASGSSPSACALWPVPGSPARTPTRLAAAQIPARRPTLIRRWSPEAAGAALSQGGSVRISMSKEWLSI